MGNPKKSKKPETRRRRTRNDAVADWGNARPELLVAVIAAITKGDGAIRLGYSRDGGAYSVGIYGDGEPFTEYLGATADLDEWLEGIRMDYE